jgi:hypothetical protein
MVASQVGKQGSPDLVTTSKPAPIAYTLAKFAGDHEFLTTYDAAEIQRDLEHERLVTLENGDKTIGAVRILPVGDLGYRFMTLWLDKVHRNPKNLAVLVQEGVTQAKKLSANDNPLIFMETTSKHLGLLVDQETVEPRDLANQLDCKIYQSIFGSQSLHLIRALILSNWAMFLKGPIKYLQGFFEPHSQDNRDEGDYYTLVFSGV